MCIRDRLQAVDLTPPTVRAGGKHAQTQAPAVQLTLFGGPDPVAEAVKALDINALSPLEALNKLYELQKMANSK